eukprot:c8496_g1_i1.p1 GENE.c8496_g1_i1~~c8496_g1_i1.p1  ORF type:complete len:117 (-),score=22.60 c8496_g1_i1:33-383(-)
MAIKEAEISSNPWDCLMVDVSIFKVQFSALPRLSVKAKFCCLGLKKVVGLVGVSYSLFQSSTKKRFGEEKDFLHNPPRAKFLRKKKQTTQQKQCESLKSAFGSVAFTAFAGSLVSS